jgi:CRP-like cAMP-binding protein
MQINKKYKGESFGELALIDKKPRMATITCLINCDFITFDKASFDRILSFFFV